MKLSFILKLALGFIALLLGTIGLVLPVWPTTPFVLVAVGCFSSTPRIQAKILQIRFFREYYDSYTMRRGLRRQTVAVSLTFLWGMLLFSALLVQNLPVRFVLLAVGVTVTGHILWIARARANVDPNRDEENLLK